MKKNTGIWLIILWATLWIVGVVVRLLSGRNTTPSQEDYVLPTNKIIEDTANVPDSCQLVIELFDCINQSDLNTGNKQALNQYFLQLLSERNTSTTNSQLEQQCSEHYSYMISLESQSYWDTIALCRKA